MVSSFPTPPLGYSNTQKTGRQMSSKNNKKSPKHFLSYECSRRGSSSSFSGRRSSSYSGSSLTFIDEKAVADAEEMVVSCKCSIRTSPSSFTCFRSKILSRGQKRGGLETKSEVAKD